MDDLSLLELKFSQFWHRRRSTIADALLLLWSDKLSFFSVIYLIALVIASAASPVWVGSKIVKVDFESFLQPPSIGVNGHIFGTDSLGKDMFARILIASRVSLSIAAVVVAGSTLLGLLLGIIAGYYRGFIDNLIMRIVDLMMAFPSLLLVLVVIFIAGSGTDKVILVLTLTGWTGYARVARAETMRLRELQFIESARCIGCKNRRILLHHITPNLISITAVLASLGFVSVIMTESGLSFLGMGIQPPDVSWGLLVAEGRGQLANAWWLAFFPGAAILTTATAFSLISNWISVVVDPVQRSRMANMVQRSNTAATKNVNKEES